MDKNQGIFKTRLRFIKAEIVKNYITIIDKNGEEFVGVPGDIHIYDEEGYEYFLNKHTFKILYQPHDKNSFDIFHRLNGGI